MAATDQQRTVYGPYYRLASETQDADAMVKQLLSGELWGEAARFGIEPAAKAYRGALPAGDEGFEFWAFDAPDGAHGVPVYWREPSENLVIDGSLGVAKLKIAIVLVTQSLHTHAP